MIQTTTYEDLSFMKAKYVMTDRRSRLTPVMFEAIMFLKVNRDFWDSRLVAKAYERRTLMIRSEIMLA
ncbi:hypothetical protein DVH05_005350 [Phytophthora capsici]|nr:hypothetical protein DVH05_005350 [Phytophthora capsici]